MSLIRKRQRACGRTVTASGRTVLLVEWLPRYGAWRAEVLEPSAVREVLVFPSEVAS